MTQTEAENTEQVEEVELREPDWGVYRNAFEWYLQVAQEYAVNPEHFNFEMLDNATYRLARALTRAIGAPKLAERVYLKSSGEVDDDEDNEDK